MDEKKTEKTGIKKNLKWIIPVIILLLIGGTVLGIVVGRGGKMSGGASALDEALISKLPKESQQLYADLSAEGTDVIELEGSIEVSPILYINGDKTLSGGSIISDGYGEYIIVINEGASLTIDGTAIDGTSSSPNGIYVSSGAKLAVKSGSVSNVAGHAVRVLGNAEFSGGAIENAGTNWVMVDDIGTVAISGGKFTAAGESGILTAAGSSTKLGGGAVLENSAGNLVYNSGNMEINGGTYTGAGDYAIYNSGSLKINNTDFTGAKTLGYIDNDTEGTVELSGGSMSESSADFIFNKGTLNINGTAFASSASTAIENRGSSSVLSLTDVSFEEIGKNVVLNRQGTVNAKNVAVGECGGIAFHNRAGDFFGNNITVEKSGGIGFMQDFAADGDTSGAKTFEVDGFEIGFADDYGIRINGGEVKLSNGTVGKCASYGLYIKDGNVTTDNCNFLGTTDTERNTVQIGLSSSRNAVVVMNNTNITGGARGITNHATLTFNSGRIYENTCAGNTKVGGGINNDGTLYINGGSIEHNSSISSGGGIYNTGECVISDGEIKGNKSGASGGGVAGKGKLTINGGSIYCNKAVNYGGGIYYSGELTYNDGKVYSNYAYKGGGGIDITGTAMLLGGKVSENSSNGSGGGIYTGGDGETVISGMKIEKNISYEKGGGGVYNLGWTRIEGKTLIQSNSCATYGGGVSNSKNTDGDKFGFMIIDGGKITGNTATQKGAGINNSGYMQFVSGEVSANTTAGDGAGIYNSNNLKLSGGVIKNNRCELIDEDNLTTAGAGGGLNNSSYVEISGNVEITGNFAEYYGGGIYSEGLQKDEDGNKIAATVMLSGGTISKNTSNRGGGGIYNAAESNISMTGGTVTGNAVGTYYKDDEGKVTLKTANGAGIYTAGNIDMYGGTVDGNASESPYDFYVYKGTARLNDDASVGSIYRGSEATLGVGSGLKDNVIFLFLSKYKEGTPALDPVCGKNSSGNTETPAEVILAVRDSFVLPSDANAYIINADEVEGFEAGVLAAGEGYVKNLRTGAVSKLKDAVENAEAGDTLKLLNNVKLEDALKIGKKITIEGNGRKIIISKDNAGITADAKDITIKDLTLVLAPKVKMTVPGLTNKAENLNLNNVILSNLKSSCDGAAIYNFGTLVMEGGSVEYCVNSKANGKGVIDNNSTASFNGTTFIGNTAAIGGSIYNEGKLELTDSSFEKNNAKTGKDVYQDGTLNLSGNINADSIYLGNTNPLNLKDTVTGSVRLELGSDMRAQSEPIKVLDSSNSDNVKNSIESFAVAPVSPKYYIINDGTEAGKPAGTVSGYKGEVSLTAEGKEEWIGTFNEMPGKLEEGYTTVKLLQNWNIDSESDLTDVTLDLNGNTLKVNSGANADLNNVKIINSSNYTPENSIVNNGTLTLDGCTVTGLKSSGDGGAINNAGTLTINNSTFTKCSGNNGGAINNAGTLNLEDSRFSGNISSAYGQDIYLGGTVNLSGEIYTNAYLKDGKKINLAGEVTGNVNLDVQNAEAEKQVVTADEEDYLNRSYTCFNITNTDNFYELNYEGKLKVTEIEAVLLNGSETVYSGSFSNVIATAQNGETAGLTVKLLKAVTVTEDVSYTGGEDKPLNINLNGKTLTVDTNTSINLNGANITTSTDAEDSNLINNGTLTLTDCTISGLKSTGNGGAVYNGGTFNMTGGSIEDCKSSGSQGGGAVFNKATVKLNGVNIVDCQAIKNSEGKGGNGGVIYTNSEGTTTLENCTVTNCSAASYGGAIYNAKEATLKKVTVTGCTAGSGGAIYTNSTGTTTLGSYEDTDCTISGCTATNNGGAVYNGGNLHITGGTFSGNSAKNGADLYLNGTQSMSGEINTSAYLSKEKQIDLSNTVTGEVNLNVGGTVARQVLEEGNEYIESSYSSFHVTNTGTNDTCYAVDNTGVVYKITNDAVLLNTNGTVINNGSFKAMISAAETSSTAGLTVKLLKAVTVTEAVSYTGGEDKPLNIDLNGKILTADKNVSIKLNGAEITTSTDAENSNLINNGTLTLTDCTISGLKSSTNGGAVYNGGTFNMTGGSIEECESSGSQGGGAVFNKATANLTDVTMIDCRADSNGGAIYTNSTGITTLENCTISECTATSNGGAVYNGGALTITGGKIQKCESSSENGGAIYNIKSTELNQVTFSSNTATKGGGALYNTSILNLNDVKISSCSSGTSGGAIYNNGTSATLNIDTCNFSKNSKGTTGYGDDIYQNGVLNLQGKIISNSIYMKQYPLYIINEKLSGSIKLVLGGTVPSDGVIAHANSSVIANDSYSCISIAPKIISKEYNYYETFVDATDIKLKKVTTEAVLLVSGQNIDSGKLTEMIGAATDNQTVRMLKDVTYSDLSKTTEINNSTKRVTVDLNGHTITVNGNSINEIARVEITNIDFTSKVNSTDKGKIIIGEFGVLTLNSCKLKELGSTDNGGAINNAGTFTMINGSISNCISEGTYGGGALYNKATANLNGVTISNCSATASGGAIYTNSTGKTTLGANNDGINCTISSCTATSNGGAVYNGGTFAMTGGSITGSGTASAASGGAIYNVNTATLENVTIDSCSATANGGAIYTNSAGTTTLSTCTIENCQATANGGAIYSGSSPDDDNPERLTTIKNCIISGCEAASGGAIYNAGTVTANGGSIEASTANGTYGGGALYNKATANLTDVTMIDCRADSNGGAIYTNSAGTTTLTTCTIKNCEATSNGGAIYSGSSPDDDNPERLTTIKNCIISGCEAASGGAIYTNSAGTTTFDGCSVSACTATSNGGAIYNGGTTTVINGTTVGTAAEAENQNATGEGGAIYNAGTLNMTGGSITGYKSNGTYGGGALYNKATANLNGVTISNCSATASGGAIYTNSAGTTTLGANEGTNCTISGCTATLDGGAIKNNGTFNMAGGNIESCSAESGGAVSNNGTANLSGVWIGSCSASNGGGIYNNGSITITSGSVVGCTASSNGGGVYSDEAGVTVLKGASLITGCSASNGGGVYCKATEGSSFTMTDGTISGCSVSGYGGGLYKKNGSTCNVDGCSITGNSAEKSGEDMYESKES